MGDDKDEIPTVYRFCKMLMGCRDSPFQSNSVIEHHLDELIATSDDEKIIEACLLLKRMMYIDDIILALRSVQERIEMRKTNVEIFDGYSLGENHAKFDIQRIQDAARLLLKEFQHLEMKHESERCKELIGLCDT